MIRTIPNSPNTSLEETNSRNRNPNGSRRFSCDESASSDVEPVNTKDSPEGQRRLVGELDLAYDSVRIALADEIPANDLEACSLLFGWLVDAIKDDSPAGNVFVRVGRHSTPYGDFALLIVKDKGPVNNVPECSRVDGLKYHTNLLE